MSENTETTLEKVLTTARKADMISFLNANPNDFDEAIELALANKQPYSWRAAWLLCSCIEKNDYRLQGYIKVIISVLTSKKGGHKRELIKILLQMELQEEDEGVLFDVCMTAWQKLENKPSVRFTAFQMIVKIARKHPDLKNEIDYLTQNEYLNSLSSGVLRSINKMRKEFVDE